MKILVTGGAGYIGSHTCVELLNAGFEVVVVDNFCNSKPESLKRVKELTGKDITFYEANVLDANALDNVFKTEGNIEAVIHFAALKAVGESCAMPLEYYHNNVSGTLVLADVMRKNNCKKIVFSSSATVYGEPASMPIREDFPTPSATNPYGQTKLVMERMLTDIQTADPEWDIVLLRYFNPIGAHESGRIGEDPNGIPNNLLPFVAQVAIGRRESLAVFGDDYPTKDGTGVRDYIHVVDLADGHVKAIQKLSSKPGLLICNLGTGNGYSVLDVVHAFEKASGRKVAYKIMPRRQGDIAECWADPSKAKEVLGWEAKRGIEQMCEDAWRWQSSNPNGFDA